MSQPALLVVSFDRYSDLWPLWFHYFFKYWPDCPYKVYLGSTSKTFDDARVTPLAIGEDRDYSSNLLRMLEGIPEEWVLVWLDDLLVTRRVDDAHLQEQVGEAQAQNAAYMKPIDWPPLAHATGGAELAPLPPGIRYRISLTVALWQKRVLQQILRPGESAWQIERDGSARTSAIGQPFLSLTTRSRSRAPLQIVNGVIKGQWTRRAARMLRRDGFVEALAGREIQPVRGHVYGIMYRTRYALLNRVLRRHWK